MTEQRVVIDAQIIAARVCSKEARRTRSSEFLILGTLRELRAFVVNDGFHLSPLSRFVPLPRNYFANAAAFSASSLALP
jgi:hypothetical protein